MPVTLSDYRVDLPSGGALHLQTPDEVQLWNAARDRYMEDYVIVKHNDLVTLGTLLQQQVIIFRCQTAINGMEAQVDKHGVPTGNYHRVEMDAADLSGYQKTLTEANKEMRALEKQLGIDRATRESGGAHTLDNYLKELKRAAHARGIHITKMVREHQRVRMEASWKIRMLYNGDAQDRAYHSITARTVLDWLKGEYARLEQMDKDFARDTGQLYAGKL